MWLPFSSLSHIVYLLCTCAARSIFAIHVSVCGTEVTWFLAQRRNSTRRRRGSDPPWPPVELCKLQCPVSDVSSWCTIFVHVSAVAKKLNFAQGIFTWDLGQKSLSSGSSFFPPRRRRRRRPWWAAVSDSQRSERVASLWGWRGESPLAQLSERLIGVNETPNEGKLISVSAELNKACVTVSLCVCVRLSRVRDVCQTHP